jgi:2-polyprenyl-6-methoxyphenol hydroxylase-like FAD-dependent oxidoreductase
MILTFRSKFVSPPFFSPLFNSGGFLPHIISRPILVDILLRLVPANKISYSKKILQVRQEDNHVVIKCSDNSEYQSDILVGADGAYSSVRQNLYKALNAKGKLPKADNSDLPFNSVCLVGQTASLDPEEFPHLKDSHTWFETMVSQDKPYAVSLYLFSTFPIFC